MISPIINTYLITNLYNKSKFINNKNLRYLYTFINIIFINRFDKFNLKKIIIVYFLVSNIIDIIKLYYRLNNILRLEYNNL